MRYPGLDELIKEGWPIAEQRLSEFFGDKKFGDYSQLLKTLLDTDIREYSVPLLANRVNNRLCELKGPIVVQISRLRNVLCSKLTDPSRSYDALNKIQLTDGHSSVNALQFDPIPTLTADTPAGTKILLLGTIPLEGGLVLINSANCRVLGGTVEQLVEKWTLEKNWIYKPTRNVDGAAPKWVPFSKRQWDTNPQRSKDSVEMRNFRANDVINNVKSKKDNIESEQFGAARKAQIEQVIAENSNAKKFAPSQLKMKAPIEPVNIVKNVRKDVAGDTRHIGDQRKGRRFNREDNDAETMVHQRPSQPPTLFDFVQPKVPECDTVSRTSPSRTNGSSSGVGFVELTSASPLNGGGNRRFEHNFGQRLNGNGFVGRGTVFAFDRRGQMGRGRVKRGMEVSNSNRNGWRENQDRVAANGGRERNQFAINSGAFPPLNTQNRSVDVVANGISAMNISASTSSEVERAPNRYSTERSGVYRNSYRRNYRNCSGMQSSYTSNERSADRKQEGTRYEPPQEGLLYTRNFMNLPPKMNVVMADVQQECIAMSQPAWKVGDKCLAPWSDGQLYMSTLVSMGPADMCSVQYDGYGNKSSVPLGALVVPPC